MLPPSAAPVAARSRMSAKKTSAAVGQMIDVGARSLDHPHLLARIDQLLHEMAADETRPAGHDRQVVHEPYDTLSNVRFLNMNIYLTRYSS